MPDKVWTELTLSASFRYQEHAGEPLAYRAVFNIGGSQGPNLTTVTESAASTEKKRSNHSLTVSLWSICSTLYSKTLQLAVWF